MCARERPHCACIIIKLIIITIRCINRINENKKEESKKRKIISNDVSIQAIFIELYLILKLNENNRNLNEK